MIWGGNDAPATIDPTISAVAPRSRAASFACCSGSTREDAAACRAAVLATQILGENKNGHSVECPFHFHALPPASRQFGGIDGVIVILIAFTHDIVNVEGNRNGIQAAARWQWAVDQLLTVRGNPT